MDIESKINFVISNEYGSFESYLEETYQKKLITKLLKGSLRDKKEWITYNQVVLELKNSLKENLKVKELQYKLTENSNPQEVCLDIIHPLKNLSPELDRLYYKIRNFR